MRRARTVAAALAGLLLLGACGGGGDPVDPSAPVAAGDLAGIVADAFEKTPASGPLVDPREIGDGGPPPDGIPSIDDPLVIDAETASTFLVETEPVLLVQAGGEARAYPLRSLTRHEIANDVLGGVPVAATWCPLCNTGLAFERTVDGEVLEFGVSGRLYRSAMVMFDRAGGSLWTQPNGTAVLGPRTGTVLARVDSELVGWGDALASHPGLTVTVGGESELRAAANPYVGYDSNPEPFLYDDKVDPRLAANERVVGVSLAGQANAWSYRHLAEVRVQPATVGGTSLVVLFEPSTRSPLDSADIREGRAVGSSGVYEPVVDGTALTFRPDGEGFRDAETGSTWLVTGVAVDGPLAGRSLPRVPSLDAFWFAWAAFTPDTGLVP